MQEGFSFLLLPHGTVGAKPTDTVSKCHRSVVEVIVRCEVAILLRTTVYSNTETMEYTQAHSRCCVASSSTLVINRTFL